MDVFELLFFFIFLMVKACQGIFVVMRELWRILWLILTALPPKLRLAVILVGLGVVAHWAVSPYPFGKLEQTKAAAELPRPRAAIRLMPSHVIANGPVTQ